MNKRNRPRPPRRTGGNMRKEKQYSRKSYFITHGAVLAVLLIICLLANVITAKYDSVMTEFFGTVGGTKTTAQAGDFVSEFDSEVKEKIHFVAVEDFTDVLSGATAR